MALSAFLAGLVGGFLYCMPVSAVNVEIIRRGLTNGFVASLTVSLGALVGDAVWLTLAVVGAEAMLRLPALRLAIGIAGTLLLLYLAWHAWRHAQGEPGLEPASPLSAPRAFGLGAVLCLASPFAVLVLLGIIGSIGAPYAGSPATTRAALYLGVLAGAMCWGIAAAAISSAGRRVVTQAMLRLVDRTAALLFVVLAALLAWQSAGR